MPVTLHAPPPLTHQDGLPPFSAQRATLAGNSHTGNAVSFGDKRTDNTNHNSDAAYSSQPSLLAPRALTAPTSALPRPLPGGRPAPTAAARATTASSASTAAPSFSSSTQSPSPLPQEQRGSPNSKRRIHPRVWAEPMEDATLDHPRPRHTSTPPLPESSSASSTTSLTADAADRKVQPLHPSRGKAVLQAPSDLVEYADEVQAVPAEADRIAYALDNGSVIAVPPPVLVEQQRQRIRELLQERDGLADALQELRGLFQRLRDDYEAATGEAERRAVELDSAQTQCRVTKEELLQVRALCDQRGHRMRQFESEWAERSKHLRAQLDALAQERDALHSQRDACMGENSELRRQLIQLQGQVYEEEARHREAVRELTAAHAQELRAALQEKDEALQARVAATRHEARLTEQQVSLLGASQSAAQEDREALRWRLSELENVVDRKEKMRSELERLVASLRGQMAESEQRSRGDAQRYTQRAQELEQAYHAQLLQEQHRCQTLQDELASARRALQEAHRQHETLTESHAAHTRELAARAAKQEDDLREQLRSTRVALTEAQSNVASAEAAAHRSRREAEALRLATATQQEERAKLQEAQAAQAQRLVQVEGKVEVYRARLKEKEREAELLRTAMEQTTWTTEMRTAMQHTLAAVMGVPRAVAVSWLQKRAAALAGGAEKTAAPQLEWLEGVVSATTPSKTPWHRPHRAAGAVVSPARKTTEESASNAEGSVLSESSSSEAARATSPAPTAETETNAFRSPVRSASASTQAAAATTMATATTPPIPQHIETIERTTRRPVTSPISVVGTSPPQGHAAPPLHTSKSPATTGTSSASFNSPLGVVTRPASHGHLQAQQHPAAPAPAATAVAAGSAGVDASANLSAASSFPLRTLSFTSAHAGGALAMSQRTPAKPRHQYNVTEGEGEEEGEAAEAMEDNEGVDGSFTGGPRRNLASGVDPHAHATAKTEEIFFDDFNTPATRRRFSQGRPLLQPRPSTGGAPSYDGQVRSKAEWNNAASGRPAQLVNFSTAAAAAAPVQHATPHQQTLKPNRSGGLRAQKNLEISAANVSRGGAQGRVGAPTPSTPGARAAELLAQLPLYTSSTPQVATADHVTHAAGPAAAAAAAGVAPSLTSTPFSSVSAAAAAAGGAAVRGKPTPHRNALLEDERGLQQYLKETVQQVLAGQQRRSASRQAAPRVKTEVRGTPLRESAGVRQDPAVRGHAHYTQLYDGSPLPSVRSGGFEPTEVDTEDFGSVSRPRSVLSALPWQPQSQRAPPAQMEYNILAPTAPVAATALTREAKARATTGAPAVDAAESQKQQRLVTEANASLNQAEAQMNKDTNFLSASKKEFMRAGASARAVDTPDTSNAHASLAQAHERACRRVEAGVAQTLEQLARRQQQLLQSLSNTHAEAERESYRYTDTAPSYASPGTAAISPVDATAPLNQLGQGQVSYKDSRAERAPDEPLRSENVSEMTSSEVVLDPRQLSYATTATTQVTDTGAAVNRRNARSAEEASSKPWHRPSVVSDQADAGTTPAAAVKSLADPVAQRDPSEKGQGISGALPDSAATPPSTATGSLSLSSRHQQNAPVIPAAPSTPSNSGAGRAVGAFSDPSSLTASSVRRADHFAGVSVAGPSSASNTYVSAVAAAAAGEGRPSQREVEVDQRREKVANGRLSSARGESEAAGTTTASLVTSVSEASSLTQLERRFAQPFE